MGRDLRIPPSVKPGIPKLGVKPKGWREVAFKDILEVVVRPADVKPNQRYQLINAKRNRGGIVPRTSLLGRQIKTTTQFFVAANDFVISRRQIVHGACGIVPSELDGALVSNEYSTLVPKNGLLLQYLGYYTHTIHFQQTCFNSSVGVAIEKMVFNLNHWLRHRLYLPHIEYQQEVVNVLATMDQTIAGVEKLITAKQMLKKGLAQQLLTGKRRLPGFRKPWGHVYIEKIAQCTAGGTPSTRKAEYWGGDVPWAQSGDIHQGVIRSIEGRITQHGLKHSSAKMFPSNTVLVALAGQGKTRGTTAITAIPLCTNQSIAGLICKKDKCHPEFLYQNLASRYQELRSLSKGDGGRGGLTLGLIRSVKLVLPPMEEQDHIAKILGTVDREINLLENKLAALHKLKKGLMEKLLSKPVKKKA